MSNDDRNNNKDHATVEALAENELLLAEKSGNRVDVANTYISEIIEKKRLQAKEEKDEDIQKVIARQQLEAMLARLDEIAKRLGEIADELDRTAKELEALKELKKLELTGKLDPNNPEHLLLFQQAGIGVNDSIDDAINDRISYIQQLHNEYDNLIAEEQQINQTIQKNYPNLATDHPEYNKIYEQKRNELLQKVKVIDEKYEGKVNIEDARNTFVELKGYKSKLFEDSNNERTNYNEYRVIDNTLDKNINATESFDETSNNTKGKTTSFANTVDTDDPFAETANISDPFNEVATVLTEQEKTLHIESKVEANLNQGLSDLSMK